MARGGKKHRNKSEQKKKRKHDDLNLAIDDSDEEFSGKGRKQPRKETEGRRQLPVDLPVPNWGQLSLDPINNNLWKGARGEENPSEDLKLLRKSIGVNVKGNLGRCPPPILQVTDAGVPALFQQYFERKSLSKPTSVQQQCWPCILSGINVLGIAPTGSGKTLAYLLPAFHQLEATKTQSTSIISKKPIISPKVLVLVPTRELALQVLSVAKSLKFSVNCHCGVLYGGQEKEAQIEELQQYGSALKVLIATPGRLLDVLGQTPRVLQLIHITYTVIDEADRMLSLGFAEQLSTVLTQIRPDKQIVLFSATFPGNLRQLSEIWAPNATVIRCNAIDLSNINQITPLPDTTPMEPDDSPPDLEATKEVEVETTIETSHPSSKQENTSSSAGSFSSAITISPTVNQLIHICAPHKRPRLLIKYIERIREEEKQSQQRQASPMIIFCNTIKTLNFVMEFLNRQKLHSVPLHGQLPQQKREENLNDLKSGKVNIVIATDVAARGIHIKRLKYVINYDFPSNIEQYCHRIGRVGRQGEAGESYSLMTRNFAPLANDLIALLKRCGKQPEPNLEKLALDYSLGKVLDTLDESLEEIKASEDQPKK